MKRLYFVLLFAAYMCTTFAQTNRYYCEVKGVEGTVSHIIIDFGESYLYNVMGDLKRKLKFVDENGKEINFNSMVDAANYMVERGWVFQQAYSSASGGESIIHWIFYKDAESFEKAREGIMTKDEYKKKKKGK